MGEQCQLGPSASSPQTPANVLSGVEYGWYLRFSSCPGLLSIKLCLLGTLCISGFRQCKDISSIFLFVCFNNSSQLMEALRCDTFVVVGASDTVLLSCFLHVMCFQTVQFFLHSEYCFGWAILPSSYSYGGATVLGSWGQWEALGCLCYSG